MAEKARIGIVGARAGHGSWGSRAHVPALKDAQGFELKAICTAHEDTAAAAAQEYGVELAFHDYKAMAASPDVDMVVVAVNKAKHLEVVNAALEAGKDIFCEWPLGIDFAEAKGMEQASRNKGVRTIIGLQGRSDPTVRYMRELIADGWIGEVVSASLTVASAGVLERPSTRMSYNPLLIGGGHSMDVLAYLVGEFAEVSATVTTQVPVVKMSDTGEMRPLDFPDHALFSGTLESGAVAQVTFAVIPFNPPSPRIEVFGREGTLVLTGTALHQGPNTLLGSKGKEPLAEMEVPEGFYLVSSATPRGPAFNVGQTYALMESAAEDVPDFAVALERHRLLEAIQRSADEGKRVKLSDVN